MDLAGSNAGRRPSVSSRRRFLKGAAAAAAAAIQLDLVDLASSLLAGEPAPGPARPPVVGVVFVRPEKPVVVSWPGGNCDVDAQQALFTATLRQAANLPRFGTSPSNLSGNELGPSTSFSMIGTQLSER